MACIEKKGHCAWIFNFLWLCEYLYICALNLALPKHKLSVRPIEASNVFGFDRKIAQFLKCFCH